MKFNKYIFILGIILFIVSFYLNWFTIIKLFLNLLAIVLIVLSFKQKFKYSLIVFIILFFVTLILDGLFSFTFKRIPIYIYNINHYNDIRVYNSFGLKVWKCPNKTIVKPFYDGEFQCNAKYLEKQSVNSFIDSIVLEFANYKGKYVKLYGRISNISGEEYIEMQKYDENGEEISFYNKVTLKIMLSDNNQLIDGLSLEDKITVIGQIKDINVVSNGYDIFLYNAKILEKND